MPVVKPKSPIRRRTEYRRPESVRPTMGLREFYDKRNKILIQRSVGGLGDILMHRMMFEDFKKLLPNAEIHFACPTLYHDAVIDHPFVDKVLDSNTVSYYDYIAHYNTTTACGRYEMQIAPLSDKHRSDIWASHCGVSLTNHDMHFRLTDAEKDHGQSLIEKHRDRKGPSVIIAPISAMDNKNLSDEVLLGVVEGLKERGCFPFGLHKSPIYALLKNDIPTIHSLKLKPWLSVINAVDYVISVDTSHLHAAGGMHRPVVGVFTFVNGPTYTQYYPTVELVQGPCPLSYTGCYNWGDCPKLKAAPRVPCCAGITTQGILSAFDRLRVRFPKA